MTTNTTDLWSGSFGNQYHDRCRVDVAARVPFWQSAIEFCTPATVFELGCGPGWNLHAIAQCAPNTDLYGTDLNLAAVNEARSAGLEVQHVTGSVAGLYSSGSMDLVFTAGCLIHVSPAQLEATMRALVDLSARWVIAIEYHAEEETEVEYRGVKGALWKRNYAKLYQDMGLRLVSIGEIVEGFDQCSYALLEKPL